MASTPAPQRLASDVSRSERRRSADRLGVLATPRAMLHAAPEPDTFAKERTMGRCPGGAIRVAVQAAPQDQLEEAPATVASKRAPSSTLRVPRRASLSGELSSEHSLEKCRQVLQLPGRALEGGARQQRPTLLGFAEQEADPLVPLPEALAALSRPGLVWSTRVQLFEGIEATSAAGGEGVDRDVGAHAERLVSALLEGTGELIPSWVAQLQERLRLGEGLAAQWALRCVDAVGSPRAPYSPACAAVQARRTSRLRRPPCKR